MLRVRILAAANLPEGSFLDRKPDAFVKFGLGGSDSEMGKTATHWNSAFSDFHGFSCLFPFEDLDDAKLKVELWDKDIISSNDFVASGLPVTGGDVRPPVK